MLLLLRWKTGSPRIRSWGTCCDSMALWDHPAQIPSEKSVTNGYLKTTTYGPKEYLKCFEILYLWSSVHEIGGNNWILSLIFKSSFFAKWHPWILSLKLFTKCKSFAWWIQPNNNKMMHLKREEHFNINLSFGSQTSWAKLSLYAFPHKHYDCSLTSSTVSSKTWPTTHVSFFFLTSAVLCFSVSNVLMLMSQKFMLSLVFIFYQYHFDQFIPSLSCSS